jgi:hypothetical protein
MNKLIFKKAQVKIQTTWKSHLLKNKGVSEVISEAISANGQNNEGQNLRDD